MTHANAFAFHALAAGRTVLHNGTRIVVVDYWPV